MAKLRLNQRKRGVLIDHAHSGICFPELESSVAEARAALDLVVTAAAAKQWPDRDLRVLRKWGLTRHRTRVTLHMGEAHPCAPAEEDNWYSTTREETCQFTFSVEAPSHKYIVWIGPGHQAPIDAWKAAKEALGDAMSKTRRAYQELILGAKYLEDITPVWPGAASLAVQLGAPPAPLARVTGEFLTIVRQDVRRRREAAAP